MSLDLETLKNARSILDYHPEYLILDDLHYVNGLFRLKVEITISENNYIENDFVPQKSVWYIVFDDDYSIDFFPAKVNSIKVTFQHQDANYPMNDKMLWGKPCLDLVTKSLGFGMKEAPTDPVERFNWYVKRMLEWLVDAINDNLVKAGDPYEVPINDFVNDFIFKENNPEAWRGFNYPYGFARVKKYDDKYMLCEIYNSEKDWSRGTIYWGDIENKFEKYAEYAIWIMLKEFPIQKPWMYPQHWSDLFKLCKQQGIDVEKTLIKHLVKNDFRYISLLLLCCPIPEHYGGENNTYYWMACWLPDLNMPTHGFRKTKETKAKYYIKKLNGKIEWLKPKNWDNSVLLSRGRVNDIIAKLSIAIIGVGALGSLVAESLARIGIKSLYLMDNDVFSSGNISRHILAMNDVGTKKTKAIHERLQIVNPSIVVKEYSENLSMDNVSVLDGVNVIIDCTASNDALSVLSKTKFRNNKLFFSGAITYGAKDLIAYYERGMSFDIDFFLKSIVRITSARAIPMDEKDLVMEGIGCYHPVFPARYDDMVLFSAMFVKQIIRTLEEDKLSKQLIVYTQHENTVTSEIIYES